MANPTFGNIDHILTQNGYYNYNKAEKQADRQHTNLRSASIVNPYADTINSEIFKIFISTIIAGIGIALFAVGMDQYKTPDFGMDLPIAGSVLLTTAIVISSIFFYQNWKTTNTQATEEQVDRILSYVQGQLSEERKIYEEKVQLLQQKSNHLGI